MIRMLVALGVFGCRTETKPILDESIEEGEALLDADGDGYLADEDCDDTDPLVYPGSAAEIS